MIATLKHRLYQILELSEPGDRLGRLVDGGIIILVVLNVLAVSLETVAPLAVQYGLYLDLFETFSVAAFSLEYLLRLWVCTEDEANRGPWGRLRHAGHPLMLIDLLAIAPFFLSMLTVDLRFLRVVRTLRFLSILKLTRYSRSLRTIGAVLWRSKEELLVTVVAVAILIVVTSGLIYFAENEAQPQSFSGIPASMWWAVATLTTVGYGDIYPITPLGKLLASFVAILGVGFVALPSGIIASNFAAEKRTRSRNHAG